MLPGNSEIHKAPERLSVTCLQAVLAALRTPKIQMIRLTLKGPDDSTLCFELSSEAGTSSFCVFPTCKRRKRGTCPYEPKTQ